MSAAAAMVPAELEPLHEALERSRAAMFMFGEDSSDLTARQCLLFVSLVDAYERRAFADLVELVALFDESLSEDGGDR